MLSPLSARRAARVSMSVLFALACWSGVPLAAGSGQRPAVRGGSDPAPLRATRPGRRLPGAEQDAEGLAARMRVSGQESEARARRVPREQRMRRAGSFDGDVRALPQTREQIVLERPEREGPAPSPMIAGGVAPTDASGSTDITTPGAAPLAQVVAPPSASFDGLDFANWGAGHPPDTNGDVGPTYYIQTINTSIGIFRQERRHAAWRRSPSTPS